MSEDLVESLQIEHVADELLICYVTPNRKRLHFQTPSPCNKLCNTPCQRSRTWKATLSVGVFLPIQLVLDAVSLLLLASDTAGLSPGRSCSNLLITAAVTTVKGNH